MFGNKTLNLNVSLSLSEASLQRLAQLVAGQIACKVIDPIQHNAVVNNGYLLIGVEESAASIKQLISEEFQKMAKTNKEQEAALQQTLNNVGVAFHDMAGRVVELKTSLEAKLDEANKKLEAAGLDAIDLSDETAGFQEIADGMTKLLAKAPEVTTVPEGTPTPTAPTLPEIPVDVSSNTVVEVPPVDPQDPGPTASTGPLDGSTA